MTFAKLYAIDGEESYVRRDEVVAVTRDSQSTTVWLRQDDNPIRVRETPAEVVKILCDE